MNETTRTPTYLKSFLKGAIYVLSQDKEVYKLNSELAQSLRVVCMRAKEGFHDRWLPIVRISGCGEGKECEPC